jgi:GAF domain-containing protein
MGFCPGCGTPLSGTVATPRSYAELQAEIEGLRRSLGEALEQQTATSEILQTIAHAQTDAQPVFDTIAVNAARLCNSQNAVIFLLESDTLRVVASHGPMEALEMVPLTREFAAGAAVIDRRIVHVADLLAAAGEYPRAAELARRQGYRTVLHAPLLRAGVALGLISIRRVEVQPFTEAQVKLLGIFADQAVIAIENTRLFHETQEALEQQTATAEILGVISSSPTDIQPVLDTVAESAAHLCDSFDAEIFRREGDRLVLVAHHGAIPSRVLAVPLARGSFNGRVALDGRPLHVTDLQTETGEFPHGSQFAREHGTRTQLGVPLMREGIAIGTISLRRTEARLFTERQVALLQTFADQAVIAIENVRLFTELQTSNRELTTALDTQTATSDILRVISRSQTDVQPVFDAIVVSAVRLLRGHTGALTRVIGDEIHRAAHTFTSGFEDPTVRTAFPRSLHAEGTHAQAIRERVPVNIADQQTDPALSEERRAIARALGHRSLVAVPLLRRGEALGTIGVTRREAGGFTADEIALLQTFADQAVIAIENVRLFTELQSSNRDLTEALEQQTATSELLKVIGRSAFDLQLVFETLVESARRLCEAELGFVHRFDGQMLRVVATHNVSPELRAFAEENPFPIGRHTVMARAGLERRTIHIHDVQADPEITYRGNAIEPVRTALAVPMLRAAELLGVIMVYRHEVRPFSDGQISLLQTFADQAVIAIENVRLFKELEARTRELTRSVGELRALGEVGQAVSSTLDLETVLTTIVSRAVQLTGLDAGAIYEYDEAAEVFHLRATENLPEEFLEIARPLALPKGEGATGRLAVTREPVQIPDVAAPDAYRGRMRDVLLRLGHRALLAVPLISEDHIVGGLVVNRREAGEFAPAVIDLLRTFATQSALAIQNARLFREIEEKSRQLAAASQHKSEFLASMSHELRTPLNAIIGYSELLEEEAGDLDGGRLVPDLQKIATAAKHQLSLINDILDLSKVEAGRMELEAADFDLPAAIENALTLVRERAARRGITLGSTIDGSVGAIRADERKVKQVLLNLLSNAIKFTPEGGRIDVRAATTDGMVEVSVADTGVGIAPEDQEEVFEEFRQVGTADKKVEGTGLGLALCRKFVELHGGRIWVESQVDQGSTFTFTLPVRVEHKP